MPRIIHIHVGVRSIVLLLVAAGAVWMLTHFSSLLLILFLSILLAVGITPLVERLAARMPRALAILIVYLGLIAVVSTAVGLLVPVMVAETRQLSDSLPKLIQGAIALPDRWIAPYFPQLRDTSDLISQDLGSRLGALVGNVGGLLVSLGAALTTLLVSTFLILVIGFFLTTDAQFAPRFIARFFPPRVRPTVSSLSREIGERLGHWVRAQLLVGLCYGVAFGAGLALLRVPYAFSLGVAGAVLELIPYVGGVIVTALGMLVALSISPWLALGVLVLEIIVANLESHVIYPKLVGDIVGLHPLVIIIALFIGAEALGVLGALLAVPVAVVVQVLFERFYRFAETPVAAPLPEAPTLEPPAPSLRQSEQVSG